VLTRIELGLEITIIIKYYYHYSLSSLTQGIYTYIPQTNNVSSEYSVAAIL
jgi:hypothetical protein